MIDVPVVPWSRVTTRKKTKQLNGTPVPALKPNITSPCIVTDSTTGKPVLAYLKAPDVGTLRRAILSTPMTTTYRASSGMSNSSRVFGMAPRKPTQWREGCAPTSLSVERPDVSAFLADYATSLASMLSEFYPVQAHADAVTIKQVLPEWRLTEDALWTSGVINRSSSLPYHFDTNNFDAWSAMPVLRRGVTGGYLHIPEYDFVVECRDGMVLFWSGYQLLHGVTPMTVTQPDGYRYTVVYYALKGMKDCFTHAVEQQHARLKRTERERVDG